MNRSPSPSNLETFRFQLNEQENHKIEVGDLDDERQTLRRMGQAIVGPGVAWANRFTVEANEQMRKAVRILVMASLSVAVWTFGSHSDSIAVCTKTGILRYLNTQGAFHSQRIEETPLSRVVIFRDDTKKKRDITVYTESISLDEVEGFSQIFRQAILWDFIDGETLFPDRSK